MAIVISQNIYETLSAQEDEKLRNYIDAQEQAWIKQGFPSLGSTGSQDEEWQEPKKTVSKRKNTFAHKPKFHLERKTFDQEKAKNAEQFRYSKPCSRVERILKNPEGQLIGAYGVCTREECFYAHSIAELCPIQCRFGERCYKEDCYYYHPAFETKDEFFARTKSTPDLPPTNEHTRKPKQANVAPTKATKEQPKVVPTKNAKAPTWDVQKPVQVPCTPVGGVQVVDTPVQTRAQTPTQEPPQEKVTKIVVPKCLFEQAMMMAITQGLTNFEIVTSD